MISPFEVYLFMQAGNIAIGFVLISIVLLVMAMGHAMSIDMAYGEEKDFTQPKRNVKIACVLFLVAIFIPSRETIAAMYILPKITSQEFVEPVTAEAKEIYELLKQALKEKGGDK